jgi:hypothetical protein
MRSANRHVLLVMSLPEEITSEMILYKRHKQDCQYKNGSGEDPDYSYSIPTEIGRTRDEDTAIGCA